MIQIVNEQPSTAIFYNAANMFATLFKHADAVPNICVIICIDAHLLANKSFKFIYISHHKILSIPVSRLRASAPFHFIIPFGLRSLS